MFTSVLDRFEQKDLISLIFQVAKCDEERSAEEQAFLKSIMAETGISFVPDAKASTSFAGKFVGKPIIKRRAVFYEVYCMMAADGMLSTEEFSALKEIQLALDLSMGEYNAIIEAADSLLLSQKKLKEIVLSEE